jgi:hypothetical protein
MTLFGNNGGVLLVVYLSNGRLSWRSTNASDNSSVIQLWADRPKYKGQPFILEGYSVDVVLRFFDFGPPEEIRTTSCSERAANVCFISLALRSRIGSFRPQVFRTHIRPNLSQPRPIMVSATDLDRWPPAWAKWPSWPPATSMFPVTYGQHLVLLGIQVPQPHSQQNSRFSAGFSQL